MDADKSQRKINLLKVLAEGCRKHPAYRAHLEQFTKKLGVEFIDASQILDFNERSADYALKGPHLSPNGYAKIARILALKD